MIQSAKVVQHGHMEPFPHTQGDKRTDVAGLSRIPNTCRQYEQQGTHSTTSHPTSELPLCIPTLVSRDSSWTNKKTMSTILVSYQCRAHLRAAMGSPKKPCCLTVKYLQHRSEGSLMLKSTRLLQYMIPKHVIAYMIKAAIFVLVFQVWSHYCTRTH